MSLKGIMACTWYDEAEKIESNGTDSHVSINQEGHDADPIEYYL